MPMNRDEPPETDQSFELSFSGLLQRYSDWKLKCSLAKIKKYKNTLMETFCNGCFNGPIENCKYREERQTSGCKFWQDKICDYRQG